MGVASYRAAASAARSLFLRNGLLPFVLVAAIIGFGVSEPLFLTWDNVFNLARHSTYLLIVSMGQMIALLVRGVDMSVGSTAALVSVCTALVMSNVVAGNPEAIGLAVALGVATGLGVGLIVGMINGLGIAILNVNPFIMTVAMLAIALGVALKLSGGMPVYGMPPVFSQAFGYSAPLGIPAPVLFAAGAFALLYYILYWTPLGRHIYAIGGNPVASHLAGINTKLHLVVAYTLCSLLVAFAGILLTARINTGEATLGQTLIIESISAVVIAGVSFFGGIGRLTNVALGAIFVTMMTNGMNLNKIDSYTQQIVLGCLLILAVAVDQVRIRFLRQQAAP